ncbi:aKG-HExxH-type peptide beta-hydroxylase [Nonomuraea mesophila]|uniref:aKG-HExxH-type peptide beta-hydroxylase n=1 Tax=Nonomuraea mesophila TaxID=2530382 RepID=UPI001408C4AF|nr:HEXXH motif-containing putative peptide modification protein [Nonomuraea mesophila]
MTRALSARLPAGAGERLMLSITLFDQLSPEGQRDVVKAPLFGYWWHRLSVLYREARWEPLERWSAHLPRFLIRPLLTERIPFSGVVLPAGDDGHLWLPGMYWRIRVDAPTVIASSHAGRLELAGGVRVTRLALAETPPDAEPLERLPGDILVSGDDPWVADYLHRANANSSAEGGLGDVSVAKASEAVSDLADAMARVDSVWPEMAGEIRAIVQQIVPIHSQDTMAFSNTALDGLLFIRTDLADPVVATERLIHETSHLRLNAVFTLSPFHDHPPSDRLHSPYRKTPRPVDGLVHGAFVFARIAEFHDRARRVSDSPAWSRRLREVLELQAEALDLIDSSVRLTPFGRAQCDDFRRSADTITSALTSDQEIGL